MKSSKAASVSEPRTVTAMSDQSEASGHRNSLPQPLLAEIVHAGEEPDGARQVGPQGAIARLAAPASGGRENHCKPVSACSRRRLQTSL